MDKTFIHAFTRYKNHENKIDTFIGSVFIGDSKTHPSVSNHFKKYISVSMSIYSNLYIKFSKQKGLPVRNSPFYFCLIFPEPLPA